VNSVRTLQCKNMEIPRARIPAIDAKMRSQSQKVKKIKRLVMGVSLADCCTRSD